MTHILTHTENLQSHPAGALRSARWLYAFVLIPFHCFQQRKMRPFPCQRKLTHTDDAGGSDPHRDPHGETSGRNTWSKEFPTSSFLGQKRPQTLMPQRLEGILSLGKDEVGGSNPPSSSKKSCFLSKTGLFLYFFANLICGSRCGTVLTHTVTHTRKCAEGAKKERKGSSAIYQMAFATFNAQYAYSFIF